MEERYVSLEVYSISDLESWWKSSNTPELTRQMVKTLIDRKDWKRIEEILSRNKVAHVYATETNFGISFKEVIEWIEEN